MPRNSNRRYPPIKCKNPECGITFIPHDRRQEYCETQCRIDAANDRRHENDNTKFIDEKRTRKNNKILASVWKKQSKEKNKLVSKQILDWLEFKFDSQSMINRNTKTNGNVLWFHDYGLELKDQSQYIFEVHKRTI